MSKGVSKELQTEIHRVLGDMVSGGPATRFSLNSAAGPLQRDAAIYLSDKGAFKQTDTGTFALPRMIGNIGTGSTHRLRSIGARKTGSRQS